MYVAKFLKKNRYKILTNLLSFHLQRPIVGLKTDNRTAFAEAMLNPMISQALDKICLKEEELLDYLRQVLKDCAPALAIHKR
jgi:hypothetical protein